MKSMSRPLVLLVAFSGGLVLSDACTSSKANSDHCSLLEGDATCADRYPGEFEFCGGDCVDPDTAYDELASPPSAVVGLKC